MDWHRADIIAELHKRNLSLRQLSQQHGMHPDTLKHALQKPWPKAEKIIADAIEREPSEIWPSRYLARY